MQVDSSELVAFEPLDPQRALPLVARPAGEGDAVDLLTWAADNRRRLEDELRRHGGILFRGFGIESVERFQELVRTAAGDPLEYRQRATPRSRVEGKVYTSTDYPPDQAIELHNESCYARTFPRKIFFFCVQPAEEGGETPIADCRGVYRRLDEGVRRRFEERGVLYQRNFGSGVGIEWRTTFGVDDRESLARVCRQDDIEIEWRDEDHLVTRQVRPAVVRHPDTDEPIWFNQAVAFHVSTLDPSLRRELLAQFGEKGVPKNAFYGDGSTIDGDTLEELRHAYDGETVVFPWQKGDVLMLDNMLAAHGRRPYSGPRRIVVAMAEPHTLEGVATR